MIIESIGHGIRILIQTHPRTAYTKNIDRTTAMFKSIENFEFKNEEHRLKLINYIKEGYVVYTDYNNISVEMSISDLEKYKIIRRD